MSKRRQPPSPAVESPLAAVSSKPAPGKRQDQRPSPAAQRAAAAEAQATPADPLPSDAHAAAKQLSEQQKKFLTGFGIDGSPLPSTPDGKKKELDGSPPGSGSGSGSDAGSAQKKDGKKKRSSSGGSRQELTGLRGGGRWTKEEDDKLRAGVSVVGPKNWKRISDEFLGSMRSDVQCLHRWQKVLRPGLVKGAWTKEEDETVIRCIQAGITKWSEIAERVPGRIGKQCRERWFNHLDPSIKKGGWTEEEDRILIEAQARVGNRWNEIARLIPGRTENSVKNRWNSAMRREWQARNGVEPGDELKDSAGGRGTKAGAQKLSRHKSLSSLGPDAPHQRMKSLDDLQSKARMLQLPRRDSNGRPIGRPPLGALGQHQGNASMGPGGGAVSARELEAMYRAYLNGVAHSRPDSMPHPRGLVPPVQISAGQQGSHSGGIGSHTADGAPVSMAGAAPGMIRAGAAARLGEQLQWDFHGDDSIGEISKDRHSVAMERIKDELFGEGALGVDEGVGAGGFSFGMESGPMAGAVTGDSSVDSALTGAPTPPEALSQSLLEMSLDDDAHLAQLSPNGLATDSMLQSALASLPGGSPSAPVNGKSVLQQAFSQIADNPTLILPCESKDDYGDSTRRPLGGMSPQAKALHHITSIFKMGDITGEQKTQLKDALIDTHS